MFKQKFIFYAGDIDLVLQNRVIYVPFPHINETGPSLL